MPRLWEELSKSNWSKFNSAGVRIFPNQCRKAASLGRFIEAGDTSADAKQAAAGRLMRRLENLTFIDISRESKRCGGGSVPLTPQLSPLVPGAEVDTQRARLSDDSSGLICLLPESDGSRRKIPGVERRHPCDRHGQPPRPGLEWNNGPKWTNLQTTDANRAPLLGSSLQELLSLFKANQRFRAPTISNV